MSRRGTLRSAPARGQTDLALAFDLRVVCGVDEAGRGPLAGPVVAAAVVLDPDRPVDGLRDSKQLSAARREALAVVIRERALGWAGRALAQPLRHLGGNDQLPGAWVCLAAQQRLDVLAQGVQGGIHAGEFSIVSYGCMSGPWQTQ
jgi:hypothetical protein